MLSALFPSFSRHSSQDIEEELRRLQRKLTVAEKLAELTGYKLFHNHLIADFITSIFGFGTATSSRLKKEIRLIFLKELLKEKISGIITTSTYQKLEDDTFIKELIETIEGGELCFVQLICDKNELLKRAIGESRKRFDKAKTEQEIENYLNKGDFFSPIPYKKSLIIDNTNATPENVVKQIKDFYNL